MTPQKSIDRNRTHRVLREAAIPLGFLAVAFVSLLIAILLWTGGALNYSLDDPYIHLALAEEIARGNYGVNPGSFSAPSSSILWPFLLVPLARLSVAVYVPLFYNAAAAGFTVLVYWLVMKSVVGPEAADRHRLVVGISVIGLLIATNVVGLIFTGMEHSLQVLLAAVGVLGLWREYETGRLPRWLVAALILGPLVRYENLALSGPAFVYLFVRGYRRPVVVAVVLLAAVLGAFSAFLIAHGGGLLPSSVLAKSVLDDGLRAAGGALANNMRSGQGRVLAVGMLALLIAALSSRRVWAERGLSLVFLATAVLHLAAGRFGWQSRYEVYAWTVVLLGLVLLYRSSIGRFLREAPVWKSALLCAAMAAVLGMEFIKDTLWQPLAAQNIYEQQYQLHRLAADYYPLPVAVNDIGWTAFRNDHFVLDLIGLGQYEVLALRSASPDSVWITPLAEAHGVGLALVYGAWFAEITESWKLLGVLRRDGKEVGAAGNHVHVFARNEESAATARPALTGWAASLPPGVQFEWAR